MGEYRERVWHSIVAGGAKVCRPLTSVVNYLLGYRENPESIDERSIDESFLKVLANSPRSTYPWIEIDVPSDSHAIHFHATKYPKIAWKGSNRTKIKNTSTLDPLGRNKNDDEALWWDKNL